MPLTDSIAIASAVLRHLSSTRLWNTFSPEPLAETLVPADFLGINVADHPTLEGRDYVLGAIGELQGIQLRLDCCYFEVYDVRPFLRKLLQAGHRPLLRLVQPVPEAQAMASDLRAQQRWVTFLEGVFEEFAPAGQVVFEIGSTPNRKKWSGYRYAEYFKAWELACGVAEKFDVILAGPNVSDFEPLHSLSLLAGMRKRGRAPEWHTVNLFVERVREPEATDHRVLGTYFDKPLALNLIKKAKLYQGIGEQFAATQTLCTHTCWHGPRLARWTSDIEGKRRDYLVRYILLAASAGALSRVYWGPLIGSPEGLIDDGTNALPAQERVTVYPFCDGEVTHYEKRPAFRALAFLSTLLPGSTLLPISGDSYWAYRLTTKSDARYEVYWCRDDLTAAWPTALNADAIFFDACGEEIERPECISDSPVFCRAD